MTNWEITGKWIKKGQMTTKTQVIAARNLDAAWTRALDLLKGAAEIRCQGTQANVTTNVKTRTTGAQEPEDAPEGDAKANVFVEKAAKKNPFLKNPQRKASS